MADNGPSSIFTAPKKTKKRLGLTTRYLTPAQKLRIQVEYYECGRCQFRDNDLQDFLSHCRDHRNGVLDAADLGRGQEQASTSVLFDMETPLGDETIVDELAASISSNEPLKSLDDEELDTILPTCEGDRNGFDKISRKSPKKRKHSDVGGGRTSNTVSPKKVSRRNSSTNLVNGDESSASTVKLKPIENSSNGSTVVKRKRGRPKLAEVGESKFVQNASAPIRIRLAERPDSSNAKPSTDVGTERQDLKPLKVVLIRCDGLVKEPNLSGGKPNKAGTEGKNGFRLDRKRKLEEEDSEDSVPIASIRRRRGEEDAEESIPIASFRHRQRSVRRLPSRYLTDFVVDDFEADDNDTDEATATSNPLSARRGRKRRRKDFEEDSVIEEPGEEQNRPVYESDPELEVALGSGQVRECSVTFFGVRCRNCDDFKTTVPNLLKKHFVENHRSDDDDSESDAGSVPVDDDVDDDVEPCQVDGSADDNENRLRSPESSAISVEKCIVIPIVVSLQKPILKSSNS